MNLTDLLAQLGPGIAVQYLAEEAPREWHCELRVPIERYSVTLVCAEGTNPDDALMRTVRRALEMFRRESVVAA